MTPPDMQLLSLILAASAALLNVILIPLVKSSLQGKVVELVSEHNDDPNAHPARTMAARDEVTKAAEKAQNAVDRVADVAQEAAARVALTAEAAAARVATSAQSAVDKVRDGLGTQFEKIYVELRDLRKEISDLRLELITAQNGRIRKTEREA